LPLIGRVDATTLPGRLETLFAFEVEIAAGRSSTAWDASDSGSTVWLLHRAAGAENGPMFRSSARKRFTR
jgi:hypothetical protein